MKTLNSIFLSLVALFCLPGVILAHEGHEHSPKLNTPVCETLSQKIEGTIIRFNENGQKQKTQFQELQAELQEMKIYLQVRGANTQELDEVLPRLDQKIVNFNQDLAKVVSKLQEAQQYPCTTTNGKFRSELQVGLDQQQVVKQDLYEVKHYYLKVVQPSLIRAYSQLSVASSG
jgi:uncharacterized protein (DUF3084 family)